MAITEVGASKRKNHETDGAFIDIDLYEGDIGVFPGESGKDGLDDLAGTAPGGSEFNDEQFGTIDGLVEFFLKIQTQSFNLEIPIVIGTSITTLSPGVTLIP